NGVAIYCNKAFENNYGMNKEEVIGKHIDYLIAHGYCDKSPLPLVMKYKRQFSIQQTTKTGRNLIVTATPKLKENGDVDIIVENCRDITELKKMRENLESVKQEVLRYRQEVEQLRREEIKNKEDLIVKSSKFKAVMDIVERISDTGANILITGESGTGKSMLAKHIHRTSSRKEGPFIKINCTTISPNLLESELFGYVGGAFSGANKQGKIGLVELADGGTLFLDEIGEIPFSLQAKFLDLIQEKAFTPVGGTESKSIDVRIIAATNARLDKLVGEKVFREDLYYRLKVIELDVPPLRERQEEIVEMSRFFIAKFNEEYNRDVSLTPECINILKEYKWPGNIRELRHILEHMVVTAPCRLLGVKHMPDYILNAIGVEKEALGEAEKLDDIMERVEKETIRRCYKQYGNSYRVADALGISQSKASRLYRKYIK
ncbi:MAG: sigma-54 dependent regulatory protein, partial [Firmicutes bacterium]|nr:sigma-54 dependent regulatory protein [Bacillota bacterium]